MSRPSAFLIGAISGAAVLYAAMNYHVIRARDGFHVVPKQPPRWSDAIMDVRDFRVADWIANPQLAGAVVQADKQHLLGDSAMKAVQQTVNQRVPAWPNTGPEHDR